MNETSQKRGKSRRNLARRSLDRIELDRLEHAPFVEWVEQQVPKVRKKRDFILADRESDDEDVATKNSGLGGVDEAVTVVEKDLKYNDPMWSKLWYIVSDPFRTLNVCPTYFAKSTFKTDIFFKIVHIRFRSNQNLDLLSLFSLINFCFKTN